MNNDNLIWYVCYGSNLCLERFMCYLTGEGNTKYHINSDINRRCSDTTPPRDSKVIEIPYELYFAKQSKTWNKQGVCFLDPNKKSKTIGRAYLITKEQFNHVWKKEGCWYSKLIDLGQINGFKAYTFTIDSRNDPNEKPCDLYLQVVKDGLIECGLNSEEADAYLKERI